MMRGAHPLMMVGGKAEIEFAYLGYFPNTANTSSYTFSSVPLGDPSSKRLIAVAGAAVGGASASALISTIVVTPNSGSAVGLNIHDQSIRAGKRSGVASGVVPTGTSASIQMTMTGNMSKAAIAVWSIKNLDDLAPIDANATTRSTFDTTVSVPVATLPGSVSIAIGVRGSTSAPSLGGFSTVRFNTSIEGTDRMSGGEFIAEAAGTNTFTFAPSESGAAATWR